MSDPEVRGAVSRYLPLAIGVVGLSTAGVFYKLAHGPVLAIVAYRMLFAAAIVVFLSSVRRLPSSPTLRPAIARADTIASLAAGALLALDVTLWAVSLQFTSVSSAALLVSMDPVFVAVIAALVLAERPTWAMSAGMAIAIAGAVIITIGDFRISGRALAGDALALSAALAETGYLLIGRHVRRRVDTLRYVSLVYAASAACVWLGVLAFSAPWRITAHDALVSFALALCASVIGHTLVSKSLGHVPAGVVAISFLSQPIVTALLAYLFLHQLVAPLTVLGGSIALAGVGVVVFANERPLVEAPSQSV